jgi:hypothetical protein
LTGIALLLGSWLFLFHLKGLLGFCKKRLPPLEPKVFVMCEQIGETT